jgi:F-type H+-transporting ATPase subunit epsilon
MNLTILSPERKLLESVEVDEVTLPTSEGEIQILPGHAGMIGTLQTGVFHYQMRGQARSYGVLTSGFFEVTGEALTVMAETLELQGEIDIERAKRAQKQAEEMLKEANLDEHQFKKYQLKLQRSLVRQQIISKEH